MYVVHALKNDYNLTTMPFQIGDQFRILHFIFLKIDYLRNLIDDQDDNIDKINIKIEISESKSRFQIKIENQQ